MLGDTIIGVAFESPAPLKSLLQDAPEPEVCPGPEVRQRLFKIRSADSSGERSSASILINRMYATRGYLSTPLPAAQLPTRITLVASDARRTLGSTATPAAAAASRIDW